MTVNLKNISTALWLITLLLLAIFNLFTSIDKQQIMQWDEARHIASALEMLQNKQWIVTTYMGETDYWNVKPPLSIWATALSYSLFNPPLYALRLPSLIAALITTGIIFLYAFRWAGFCAGLLASSFFLTAWPIFTSHAARTADPDMLFILCVTLALFLLAKEKNAIKWAYISLGFSFLAKSFHAAPYCLAAFIYCVYLYKQKRLSLNALIVLPFYFLLPVLPWVVARYLIDGSHFFEVMLFYDVLKRSTDSIAGVHGESALHYFYVLFCCGVAFSAVIAFLTLFISRSWYLLSNKQLLLPLLWSLLPLAVYMSAATKLDWYIYAILPPLFILCAAIIVQSWQKLSYITKTIVVILLGFCFILQESLIIDYVIDAVPIEDNIESALSELKAKEPDKKITVFMEANANFFYQHHYATALMLGNIVLAKGGKTAFLQTKAGNAIFLISSNGKIIAR